MGGLYTPPSEEESLYWDQLLAWRASANYSWMETPSSLAGQFAVGPVAVVGHSMGGGERGWLGCWVASQPGPPAQRVHPPTAPPSRTATHPAPLAPLAPLSFRSGLASIHAGLQGSQVGAVALLDPVDFTAFSRRVARRFLAE